MVSIGPLGLGVNRQPSGILGCLVFGQWGIHDCGFLGRGFIGTALLIAVRLAVGGVLLAVAVVGVVPPIIVAEGGCFVLFTAGCIIFVIAMIHDGYKVPFGVSYQGFGHTYGFFFS